MRSFILPMFFFLSILSCRTYEPLVEDKDIIIVGRLISESDGKPRPSEKISEIYRNSNNTYTDYQGYFRLELRGKYPIIEIKPAFHIEPIFFKLEIDKFNEVKLKDGTYPPTKKKNKGAFNYKPSRRVYKAFFRSKKIN